MSLNQPQALLFMFLSWKTNSCICFTLNWWKDPKSAVWPFKGYNSMDGSVKICRFLQDYGKQRMCCSSYLSKQYWMNSYLCHISSKTWSLQVTMWIWRFGKLERLSILLSSKSTARWMRFSSEQRLHSTKSVSLPMGWKFLIRISMSFIELASLPISSFLL